MEIEMQKLPSVDPKLSLSIGRMLVVALKGLTISFEL